MKFVLASHNRKKLAEMQEILRELGVEVVLQSDVGLDLEPEENGVTFAENAAIKAMAVMRASGLPAIAVVLIGGVVWGDSSSAILSHAGDFSWFIGCGLGFAAFWLLERRRPRIVALDDDAALATHGAGQ